MKFATYGPFTIQEMTPVAIKDTFASIEESHKNLQHAIGVYIFAAKGEFGALLPWYVGRTHREFGSRIREQLDSGKFHDLLADKGPLSLFLIPRLTAAGRFVRIGAEARAKGGRPSINYLENALIGTCLGLNLDLLNKQLKGFHKSIMVPGYLNSKPEDESKSAKSLAKMLKLKRRS